MNETKQKTGLNFSISDGKLNTIREQTVPPGTIKVLDTENISTKEREITPRAIKMTIGLFKFAQQCNRKEPNNTKKE